MYDKILNLIKAYSSRRRIRFSKHALTKAIERRILIEEIEEVLENCQIINSYTSDKPFTSYLVAGFTKKNRPIHIVIALDDKDKYIWVVTVYEPDKNKWDKTFTQRL